MSFLRSQVRLADVLDGTSHTYSIGEKNLPRGAYQTGMDRGDDQSMYSGDDFDIARWTAPGWKPLRDEAGSLTEGCFGSPHASGCDFVLCDGSVRSVSFDIDAQVHQYFGHRSDGQAHAGP